MNPCSPYHLQKQKGFNPQTESEQLNGAETGDKGTPQKKKKRGRPGKKKSLGEEPTALNGPDKGPQTQGQTFMNQIDN